MDRERTTRNTTVPDIPKRVASVGIIEGRIALPTESGKAFHLLPGV
jgi:hypothetical protein